MPTTMTKMSTETTWKCDPLSSADASTELTNMGATL